MMKAHLIKAILVFVVTMAAATYDFVVKPEFGERSQDLNITSYVGQTSRLPCTVKHLSGKRVSWIRQRDLQVLSTGRVTFSTDLRISVLPGTRFKLRKPRELSRDNPLPPPPPPPRVSNRTNVSQWNLYSSKEELLLRSPPLLLLPKYSEAMKDGEEEEMYHMGKLQQDGEDKDVHAFTTVDKNRNFRRNKFTHDDEYSPIFHQSFKRESRILGYKHHKRENIFLNRERFPTRSSQRKRRFKKALLVPDQTKVNGFSQVKSLVPSRASTKGQRREAASYDNAKQNSPIAIYSQGPVSPASDAKGLKVPPNYIDGVWEPEDYTLQIKYTKPQDAGIYICQINTEPRITQAVVLRVVKMRAEIVGRRELFVKAGNPVKLSCRVNHGALSPGFILWYKGERLVEYENSGGRIQVQTEAGGVSHLILKNAQPQDSSNYTCSPAGGAPASLVLNVIVDERPAAMQQGNSGPSATSSSTLLLWPSIILSQRILPLSSDHFFSMSCSIFPSLYIISAKYMPFSLWQYIITPTLVLMFLLWSISAIWKYIRRNKAHTPGRKKKTTLMLWHDVDLRYPLSIVNMIFVCVYSFVGCILTLTKSFILQRFSGDHHVVIACTFVSVFVFLSLWCYYSYIINVA